MKFSPEIVQACLEACVQLGMSPTKFAPMAQKELTLRSRCVQAGMEYKGDRLPSEFLDALAAEFKRLGVSPTAATLELRKRLTAEVADQRNGITAPIEGLETIDGRTRPYYVCGYVSNRGYHAVHPDIIEVVGLGSISRLAVSLCAWGLPHREELDDKCCDSQTKGARVAMARGDNAEFCVIVPDGGFVNADYIERGSIKAKREPAEVVWLMAFTDIKKAERARDEVKRRTKQYDPENIPQRLLPVGLSNLVRR